MKIKVFIFVVGLMTFSSIYSYGENELISAKVLSGKSVIVSQDSPEGYRLDDSITRKEFMKIFIKLLAVEVPHACEGKFKDVIDDWGCKYIEWAFQNELIAHNSVFRPDDSITKAESMKLVLQARKIARKYQGNDWRENDMLTAFVYNLVPNKYYDYDVDASRGWIFSIAANEIKTSSQTSTYISGKGKNNSSKNPSFLENSSNSENPMDILIEPQDINESNFLKNPSVIGLYTDYDESIVGQQKHNILFFSSLDCSECINLDLLLKEQDYLGYDLEILKVDINLYPSLIEKHKVTTLPYFVQIDTTGKGLNSSQTITSFKDIISMITTK